MNRCWLALVEQADPAAGASAEALDEHGESVGFLCAWEQQAKPVRHALRVDPRVIDSDGESAWVSLVLSPVERSKVIFDDTAVQQARRRVLAEPPADAVSTLLRDASHFEGAITARRGHDARRLLADDPFARIFPARLLELGAGLIGRVLPPAGPCIERYGSANPWPWDRFPN